MEVERSGRGISRAMASDPARSNGPYQTQFSSVLIIVPQLQELPHYQDRGERQRERKKGGGEKNTMSDKKGEQGGKKESEMGVENQGRGMGADVGRVGGSEMSWEWWESANRQKG
ncbi:hypothetical protein EYF80_015413 [Liparis tanakae]|uniref:Uncharacterized protein n=1 Tax=Liparis tanakae TaxID=230148 RepID=A0A4Z2I8Z2_9TELE|nr:hypothetical protein EYF80_015413 [Liparis tanakae]